MGAGAEAKAAAGRTSAWGRRLQDVMGTEVLAGETGTGRHRPPAPGRLTCEDHQPEAPLGVAQHTAPQQHVLVAQGELAVLPVKGPTEPVQLVVGRLADHLT